MLKRILTLLAISCLSVLIALGSEAQTKKSKSERRRVAGKLLEMVGLSGREEHRPQRLSAGEQQRVAIARALANDPAIILADEPTGNLDQKNEELVMGLIRAMHRDGHTIIIVTHDPNVGKLADRRVYLEHGSVRHID